MKPVINQLLILDFICGLHPVFARLSPPQAMACGGKSEINLILPRVNLTINSSVLTNRGLVRAEYDIKPVLMLAELNLLIRFCFPFQS